MTQSVICIRKCVRKLCVYVFAVIVRARRARAYRLALGRVMFTRKRPVIFSRKYAL